MPKIGSGIDEEDPVRPDFSAYASAETVAPQLWWPLEWKIIEDLGVKFKVEVYEW